MQQQSVGGFRLSPYQRHLWRLHPSDATSPYRSQVAVAIAGPLELDRLRHAVCEAAAAHESLRTAFERVAGVKVPLQVVTTGEPRLHEQQDVAPVDPAARRAWLRALLAADRERAVDAGEAPLRGVIVALAPDEHVLILSSIALCADRKSMLKLAAEIATRYGRAASAGDPMQYSDFSAWHNEILESAEPTDRAYWTAQRALNADVSIVTGEHGGAGTPFRPDLVELAISETLSRRIVALSAERGVAVDRFLIGCWAALLARISGQERIVVGAPVDFHGYEELERTIGLLTVNAPLSVPLHRRRTFTDVIDGVDRSLDDLA
ncbi:MAG: condensation domain-containing protein, partial [Gemmatimonadaceae bacterium]